MSRAATLVSVKQTVVKLLELTLRFVIFIIRYEFYIDSYTQMQII